MESIFSGSNRFNRAKSTKCKKTIYKSSQTSAHNNYALKVRHIKKYENMDNLVELANNYIVISVAYTCFVKYLQSNIAHNIVEIVLEYSKIFGYTRN